MNLNRELINKSGKTYFTKGKKRQADVYLIEFDNKKIVIKDFINKGFFTKIYGKYILKREYKSYKRLQDFDFIPKCFGMPDSLSLAIEFIDGKTFGEIEKQEQYCYAIEKLNECINKLHSKKIFHLDLRKRGNIIVKDDKVYLIDFASMIFLKRFSLLNLFKPIYRYADKSSVLKWKQFICPKKLTEDDKRELKRFERIRVLWFLNKPKIPGRK